MSDAKAMKDDIGEAQISLVPEAYRDEEDADVVAGVWEPKDLAQADWVLMRIGALEREITDNEEVAAKRIAEIEAKTRRLNDKAMRGVSFFRSVLSVFAQKHRELLLGGGKKKSRGLPHGTIGFRKKPGLLRTTDREALLGWAREQPVELELVRVKEEPDLERIKAHAEQEKTLPPGMQWEPETEEIQIRTDMKEVR